MNGMTGLPTRRHRDPGDVTPPGGAGGRDSDGRRRLLVMTACSGLLALVGCGPGGPALEPATGVVTLDGQPVDAATVTLAPAAGGGGIASGITDASGRFVLTTVVPGLGARPGIAAGEYAVTVTKATSAAAGAPVSDDPGFVPPVPENAVPKLTYLVPKGYGTAATSGLRATIAKGGNDLTFALDSKFKP